MHAAHRFSLCSLLRGAALLSSARRQLSCLIILLPNCFQPKATAHTIISTFRKINGTAHTQISSYPSISVSLPSLMYFCRIYVLLINVLTELIKFIILLLTLASWPGPPPNEGSDCWEEPQPMRARKRSSERIAMAFTRRTETEMEDGG